MKKKLLRAALPAAALIAATGTAQDASAAGFEKNVLWSGRYAAMANSAVSFVEGAQSLYFNPAGLTNGPILGKGLEFSVQFSPTWGQFQGPVSVPNQEIKGSVTFSPVGAALISYRPHEKFGLGIGFFVSGGTNANFDSVPIGGFGPAVAAFTPPLKSDLRVLEGTIGAAVEPIEGLRIGAAWRLTFVTAEIRTFQPLPGGPGGTAGAVLAARLTDLSDTNAGGFRAGIQYSRPNGRWGIGFNVRNQIRFTADGKLESEVFSGATQTTTPLPGGDASASAIFPWQFQGGLFVMPIERKLRFAAQYDYANYAANRNIVLTGTIRTPPPPAGLGDVALTSIPTAWNGQHVVRLGGELMPIENFAVRLGYAFTSIVTPASEARPTFTPPGVGHTFNGGVGVGWLDGHLRTDLALDYTFSKGRGDNEFGIRGNFFADAFVVHLGADYRF